MNVIEIELEDEKYPQRLLHIKNFPPKLFALGNIDLLNANCIIAIVGSRKSTEYGRKVATEFASELGKKGICIISGMAVGIDGIAHNAAIAEPGKTIAVLGGGFNHIYPPENEWLFHKILEKGGCIISEHSPETEPDRSKFPIRNRIISGVSDGVLVVEAFVKGGSTITAKYAKQEGKPVYAVPNGIYCTTSGGPNRLIQEGATLVTKPSQIIEDFKTILPAKKGSTSLSSTSGASNLSNVPSSDSISISAKKMQNEQIANRNENFEFPREYLPIYKILSDEPSHINKIAKKLNTPVQEISPVLTLMEIDGYAYQPQTNYFTRKIDTFD